MDVNKIIEDFGSQLTEAILPIILIAGLAEVIFIVIKKKISKKKKEK